MQRFKRWALVALLVLLGLEVLTIAPRKLGGPPASVPKTNVEAENVVAESSASPGPKETKETISQVMQGIHLVGTNLGQREWELDSKSAQGFKEKGTWKLQGVKVKFFGKGQSYYTVTGDRGLVNVELKDMEIFGNVVMKTSEGYSLTTDSLKYASQKKTLTTPDPVHVVGPKDKDGQFELSGTGFYADLNTNIMHLKDKVLAIKSIPPERTMTIKSVWSKINGKTNEAHFEDQVQVDIDNVRMTGNKADFAYDSSSHLLKSLNMFGNVRVTDQKRWASSQRAKVLFAEEEFVLLGNPKVIQDDNEYRGEEIKLLKGGKEIQVSKAKARIENDPKEFTK